MENRNVRVTLIQYAPLALIVLVIVLSRLVPHPPNLVPVTGIALFSGAFLRSRWSFSVPLAAMFISDALIGFHEGMGFVYGSFFLIYLLGLLLRENQSVLRLLGVTLTASVLFFVITNFGVWLQSDMYAKTLAGLRDCYIAAIPFFRNTLTGDLIYTFGFFYGYFFIHSSHARIASVHKKHDI